MKFDLKTIGRKIGFGFVLSTLVLTATVLITIVLIGDVTEKNNRINTISQPSSRTTVELQSDINRSIADLRGWTLLKRDTFRVSRARIWNDEIWPGVDLLESLAQEWTDTEDVESIERLKPLIDQLFALQNEVEEIATSDEDEAVAIMTDQLLPVNNEIKMIMDALVDYHERVLLSDFTLIDSNISFLRNVVWVLLAVGLALSLFVSYMVIASITSPIDQAVQVAQGIGAGDLETRIDVGGSEELEVLGAALIDMRDALKRKVEENRLHDWLTNGQNKLSNVMRGDQEIKELSDNIIHFLTQYTGASIGAVYLVNDSGDRLLLAGTYAFHADDDIQESFKVGEGVIGQAAASKKTIMLNGMDETQIRIRSSILETSPSTVLATPFLVNNEVMGVVEVGKLEEFTDTQIDFIESNMENVGIAIASAMAREKIQKLLEETQQQSEELQQQHEELEQNNEELEEQTHKLKEQQEELQAANEEMEEQTQIVEQKNQDLETARTEIELKAKQLEISSKYKSEFLANMSHELRTPLNSLLILGNELKKNQSGNLNPDEIENAEVIVNSGRDLLNLINEILDLSKVEAGKMELNITDIDVEEMASDLHRKFRKQAEEKDIALEVEVDEALSHPVRADRQRLEQILKNLLSNAIKFTSEGHVKMSLIKDAGDYLSVQVTDTGIGIPAGKQDVIFEAFQQAEGGTARRYGGTGLGLSISRELAKLMNGKISVKSEEGVGSTFTLLIPLNSAAAQKPAPQKKRNVQKIDNRRYQDYPAIDDQREEIGESDNVILIIEDDHDFARIIARQANQKGFKFIAATTGEDGLVLAEKYQPTAIILDLKLPGIDGHIVLKELKGDPELRHIPVHIISSEEKSLDPIKSGAVQYIAKPVDKTQLDDAFLRIEDFINRKMKSLLIVEDNDDLRKSIVQLIGNGDVVCLEASTGQQAIDQITNNKIDCIVLDIGLPDMNGFEFIKTLESDTTVETPPIVVYTGKELTRDETEQLQEYAETIIIKGIKSEERLLDETALFLHRTVKNLPKEQQTIINSLYDKEALFQNKKILLVDDDMRNVFALTKVLKDRGMDVIKADNGKVALQQIEEHPDTDLVLMDIMMPEMDGYECMQHIRNDKSLNGLPIIALTAKAMKNDRQKCLDAGADDYITKPVDIERLLSLMRIWITK